MIRTLRAVLAAVPLFLAPHVLLSQSAVSRESMYASLSGEWTGTLEYRDYQTNERVMLPTWLEVRPASDAGSLKFSYTYDDGPSKTVTEASTITIDLAVRQFSISSDRDHSSENYQIAQFEQTGSKIRLVLLGRGTENNKAVDVRITLKVDRNLYQFTKETRSEGQEFAFRDGYTFTRRMAAR